MLRPAIEEVRAHSALHPELVAPESRLPIACRAAGLEFCAREAGGDLFIVACRREGDAVQAEFTGLPPVFGAGEVMFESPRKVQAKVPLRLHSGNSAGLLLTQQTRITLESSSHRPIIVTETSLGNDREMTER